MAGTTRRTLLHVVAIRCFYDLGFVWLTQQSHVSIFGSGEKRLHLGPFATWKGRSLAQGFAFERGQTRSSSKGIFLLGLLLSNAARAGSRIGNTQTCDPEKARGVSCFPLVSLQHHKKGRGLKEEDTQIRVSTAVPGYAVEASTGPASSWRSPTATRSCGA